MGNDDSLDRQIPASKTPSASEWAHLWVTAQPAISAYVNAHVSDIHHREDLVQEVAQAVAEGFGEFDRSRSFTAWTLGIARNRILKHYRSKARDRLVLSEAALHQLAVAFETVEPQAESRREALRRCLQEIQGRSRLAIEMRYRDGARVADIAAHFTTSPSAISVMFHRVRKTLIECVQRQLRSMEG